MDERAQRREEAWIGDAVLGLFAREWILAHPELEGNLERQALFTRLTSNQFLASFGEPTAVEASFGVIYRQKGLQAAFEHLEATLIPYFQKQLNKCHPGGRRCANPPSKR